MGATSSVMGLRTVTHYIGRGTPWVGIGLFGLRSGRMLCSFKLRLCKGFQGARHAPPREHRSEHSRDDEGSDGERSSMDECPETRTAPGALHDFSPRNSE